MSPRGFPLRILRRHGCFWTPLHVLAGISRQSTYLWLLVLWRSTIVHVVVFRFNLWTSSAAEHATFNDDEISCRRCRRTTVMQGGSVTGHWSEGSLVRRVTGPTVVVADVGTVSKRGGGLHSDPLLQPVTTITTLQVPSCNLNYTKCMAEVAEANNRCHLFQ